MNHLVVGLLMGGIVFAVFCFLFIIWWIGSSLFGETGGWAAVIVFLFIVAASAIIDWRTEE